MRRSESMKKYKGIRYSFRPKSYWKECDPLSAILRNVTGENRRRMITDYWNADRIEDLDSSLLNDELDEDTRTSLGRIHPSFMGGEYLPPLLLGEVEIARICLQSTTSDVITLRARPIPEGIAYRIEDEYEATFTIPIPRSQLPLTLLEVIRQFDEGELDDAGWPEGGLTLNYNLHNIDAGYMDAEEVRTTLRHFTSMQSSVYRQLGDHFENVYDEWFEKALWKDDQEDDSEP